MLLKPGGFSKTRQVCSFHAGAVRRDRPEAAVGCPDGTEAGFERLESQRATFSKRSSPADLMRKSGHEYAEPEPKGVLMTTTSATTDVSRLFPRGRAWQVVLFFGLLHFLVMSFGNFVMEPRWGCVFVIPAYFMALPVVLPILILRRF